MAASDTVLLDALNRLGGRQDAPATARDLVAAGPPDLPLVAIRTDGPSVTGCNASAFMARAAGLEHEAMAALEQLVATGVLRAAADPGAEPADWAAANRKGVARQAVQWALDHPEHALQAEAFRIARLALG